jgi:putative Holliday junction resolvase
MRMAVVDPAVLLATLPREGRLVGLDVGTRTIGIAVSDVLRTIASPHRTIERSKFAHDGRELLKLIDHQQAAALVVGLPLNMDGTEGPRSQSVRQFVINLTVLRDLPVMLQDERLSTVAAERTMIEDYDMSRQKRAERVDAGAAAWILQTALDRLSYLSRSTQA